MASRNYRGKKSSSRKTPNNTMDGAERDEKFQRDNSQVTTSSKRSGRNKAAKNGASDAASSSGRNSNHYGWYVPNQDIVNDVSSTFFSYRTGDQMPVACTDYQVDAAPTNFQSFSFRSGDYAMPGVIALDFMPTYGNLTAPSSAGNVAATAVYSWIRHANSGARNYDRTDLMLYLLAMDSIYCGITVCQRIISTVMMYNRWNSYTPDVLLRAMGIGKQENIAGDLAQMRYRLNSMILKASTLAVPATMPIYERHAYMCSNVYVDEPNATAQFYLFKPQYLYKFGYDTKNAGCLTLVEMLKNSGAPSTTWQDIFSIVEGCIDALYGDEDAGIMSGDILKAYGESGLMKLATVTTDTVLVPIYDHDLLIQMHNATLHGGVFQTTTEGGDNFGIYQVIPDSNTVGPYLENRFTFQCAIGPQTPSRASHIILDLHTEPTVESVMRSTRLMNHLVYKSGGSATVRPLIDWDLSELGSDVAFRATVFWYNSESSDPMGITTGYVNNTFIPPAKMSDATMTALWRMLTFTLAPRLLVAPTASTSAASSLIPFAQLDRVTALSFDELDRINRVALLGLFNIPRLTLQG